MRRLLLLAVLLSGCTTAAMRVCDTTLRQGDAAWASCRACADAAKEQGAVPCDAACAQVSEVAPLVASSCAAAGRANMQRAKPAPQSQPAAPTE